LAHFGWQSGEPVVIDGVRHREVVEALRRVVAPLELRLIFLDVAEEQRRERLVREGEIDPDKMPQIEKHSTEKQVTTVLPDMADLKVSTRGDFRDVVREIVSWVHQAECPTQHAA
jgi:hypothetical protein